MIRNKQRVPAYLSLALILAIGSNRAGAAPSTTDTRFLGRPAITAGRIAFAFADDIWTARPDGTDVKRLTSHPGVETNPFFSPDGKTIAFTGEYDGNIDVFVVPAEGGVPKRLTYHPAPDVTRGWTPDGSAVLFMSPRLAFSRHTNLFTVPITGGPATRVKVPTAFKGAISADGKFLAYSPLSESFRQWKHYRGGTASRIWILDQASLAVTQVPQPDGRCNDIDPCWVGSTLYFLSDRDGEFNLYSFDTKSKAIEKLTHHNDFPIEDATAGDGKVIYEQAGYLHVFTPGAASKTSARLKIGVPADLVETRARQATGETFLRDASISPSGKRVALEFRGEIVTVPAKKGDVRNLTQTTGANERSPAWSPDGKSIAYFSDAGGEYNLHVRPQDGSGETKTFKLGGSGFYERPKWSPDSSKIAYIDNARTLYYLTLKDGAVKKIASEAIYGPINTLSYSWSPDGKWLAYTLTNAAQFQTLKLYSLDKDQSHTLNDGLVETSEPRFDPSGKYLYFFASTDAGPVKNWFDQSNEDMRLTKAIYLAVLKADLPNPLKKLSDEEGADEGEKKDKDKDKAKDDKPAVAETVIDLDGLSDRVLALPVPQGDLSNLAVGTEGQVYYIRSEVLPPTIAGREGAKPKTELRRFDLKTLEDEALAEGVRQFEISHDTKKVLYGTGEAWGIADLGKFKVGDGALSLGGISVPVDPAAEWPQIFREAWRINRDYFYAKNMHGNDWEGIRKKYEPLVCECATREDLNRVIRMMCSELAVGHSYLGGGDRLYSPKPIPVGLLGADYKVNEGRYQFAKVYGGLNWDNQLRAPLKAPGVSVKAGEYLLAVDGKELNADEDLFARFQNKAGKLVTLKVGPKPNGENARTVTVEPISEERSLRNREWIESNMKFVHEKTGGRCAYVYVPNTAGLGHEYFKRYFFPQADKQAIIVDERFNGGGSIADYYIDMLRRNYVSSWATRYGQSLRWPGAAIFGPKVMIIDETAGSGGDMLPWMFRKFQLGKLVGKRTWGGLVGILGFPVLMDGGMVTAPDIAIFNEDGYIVENEGVPPDIEVEEWPAEAEAGHDAQLEKAVEVILEELKKNPPASVKRPADPVKVK